jgi:alcohol dehydrogenase (cytochrome c)
MLKKRLGYFFAAIVILMLASIAGLWAFPKTRWRIIVFKMKASGSLPELGWNDLYRMTTGEHANLSALVETPNAYAVIKNPYSQKFDVEAGRSIFQSHCSVCHGDNGAGGPGGPVLQHRVMVKGSSDWALFRTLTFGIPGTAMQASGLSRRERWQLVAAVQSIVGSGRIRTEVHVIPQSEPVTAQDLMTAGQTPDKWLTYSGSYDSHRFSPAAQIKPSNVAGLRLLWMRQYNTSEPSIETSPIVTGEYMFVTSPPNRVEALSVKSGAVIWTYERQLPQNLPVCCGYVNRGLAVLGDTIFFGTLDAHLVALDIRTGEVRWDVEIADHAHGYSITGAPLALKNMVITGVAGGEYGIRGFLTARDVQTGKEIWRFNTIPQPGDKGSESWVRGDAWKTGGGPTWITGSFDPKTNLLYWPVGNPSPNFNSDDREGENLFTNSILALDADSGKLQWYFQFTPHDAFDWDATEIVVLFDGKIAGKTEPLLAQADRNGFYYVLNRETGKLYSAIPFGKETWADGIDSQGRPIISPKAYPTKQGSALYPGVGGATNWESPSYSPATDLMYIPVLDWGGTFFQGTADYHAGQPFTGGSFNYFDYTQAEAAIRAVNAETGQMVWEFRSPGTNVGGILSTAGGVVFGSQLDDVFALDAKTGRELWHVGTSGRIVAAPITFTYHGKQMITIAAGHDILTFGL